MNASTVQYPLTIYFDGSCPLCTREIQLLTRFDEQLRLQVVDCSSPAFAPVDGHARDDMMALIHARDAAGQWLIGAPVFAAAYRATGFGAIARLWGSPRLQPLWRIVYPWIARHRMWLSRLGAIDAMTWILHRLHSRAAARALAQSQACAADRCDVDGGR
jgi:predicted DCC family thiol-disulfide oxidoreductase YuxK